MNVDNFEGRRRGESAKDFLRRYVDWLKAAGATTVNSYNEGRRKGRDPEELQLVAHSVAMFEGSLNRVTDIVDGKLEASDAAEIYDELACMLAATRNIANYVFLPLSALPLYQQEQGHHARDKKRQIKDEPRHAKQIAAIKAECRGVAMEATRKFAESILDDVNKRLATEGEKPVSYKSIQRRIGTLLKAVQTV